MRNLLPDQIAAISSDHTKPTYLMQWFFDGTPEYLSSNGRLEFDGQDWLTGFSLNMENWSTATVTLIPEAARVERFNNSTWRFQSAIIYFLPTAGVLFQEVPITTDSLVPITTDNDEPIVLDFSSSGSVVLLDGIITGGRVGSSALQMTITHRAINGVRSPRTRLSGPRAGTVIEWEGEVYVVEGRR
jgi:hypothetical protein